MDATHAYYFLKSVEMLDKLNVNLEELYGELTSETISLTEIEDPQFDGYEAIMKAGDVSPYTSTAMMWDHKKWPIKPEIVLEGGNAAYSEKDHFYTEADDLSLLTTGHRYLSGRPFDVIRMTSSATAQAAWMAARIWKQYPEI